MTHTYAVLEISAEAYAEIREKLAAAGYQHAFNGDEIDMHGIGVRAEALPAPPPRPEPVTIPAKWGRKYERPPFSIDPDEGGTPDPPPPAAGAEGRQPCE